MKRTVTVFLSNLCLLTAVFFNPFHSCNDQSGKNDNQKNNDTVVASNQIIENTIIGQKDGIEIVQYTLTNKNGMAVKIISLGATVTGIMVPDRNKEMGDVVLGFDSLAGYMDPSNSFFGVIAGRYANRIAKGQFVLNGETYTLAKNNNGNSLHGGLKGFDKAVWNATTSLADSSLTLKYASKDGEEGYPGNMNVEVRYKLRDDNALEINYTATTDKATPVNLTNHSYFNLSAGKKSDILDHVLQLKASRFTPVDKTLIPTGKIDNVSGTPMDFRQPKPIGQDIAKVEGGFDHNWIFDKDSAALELVGKLVDPSSGRTMELWTTEPAVQFYSGNFLKGQEGKNGMKYNKHAGLCLEAQHYPDSPNQPSFPSTILEPGQTYKQTTIYKFGAE
ncbi:aldose epimerase family protein [Flavitalea antarctica]